MSLNDDPNRVIIFDTTLRDGEQSPGASMNLDEKLRIAELLAELGVDVIEAGFPIASNGDFEAVQEVSKLVKGPIICGLARSGRADIERAAEALAPAERRRIHTFIATSPLHMKYKLQMEPDDVHAAVIDSVAHARRFTDDVDWSPEDGSRTDPDFLCRCVEAAIRAGATCINLPDTVGYALPEEFGGLIRMLRERVPNSDKAIFSAHCHNDLGLAVANSLASVEAGAKVNHLSYVGDSRVGARANIGAGTITCNYDGFSKAETDIGEGAFIGSNTALVAPVTIGSGAIVGAGSVIAKDVPADSLAVERSTQKVKTGWAEAFRIRRRAKKDGTRTAQTGSER